MTRSYRRYVSQSEEPAGVTRPCVDGGEKCAAGCGATLKTSLDRALHRCDLFGTTRAALRGDRKSRSAVA